MFSESRTSILKPLNCSRKNNTSQVHFESENFNIVLRNYISLQDSKPYEELLVKLKQPDLCDEELNSILQDARESVTLMNENVHHLVKAILAIQWTRKSPSVIHNFHHFLTDLVSAHNYYTYDVLECLMSSFTVTDNKNNWDRGVPSDSEEKSYKHVHRVIKVIVKILPMCKGMLLQAMTSRFPYLKCDSHLQECYIYNLLKIISYQQLLRSDIIFLIIQRLLALDLAIQSSNLNSLRNKDASTVDEISDCDTFPSILDQLLTVLFYYSEKISSDQLELTCTYKSFLTCFEKVVLPTTNATHTQFIMFYMCSFKQDLAQEFINKLWEKVKSPNVAFVIRQNAVFYIASFLTRATYITTPMVKKTLVVMADWIHNYVSNYSRLDKVPSMHLHPVFYAVCQSLFYTITVKHKQLVTSRKDITFLQSLNFPRIVTSHLNPLCFCSQSVTANFAAVTQKYQLVYCYSIIEENFRNSMLPIVHTDERGMAVFKPDFTFTDCFPFDTLVLPTCKKFIAPLYHNYENSNIEDLVAESGPVFEPEDYFLQNAESFAMVCDNNLYGISPH